MNHANGWMNNDWSGGGTWILPVIGLLIIVLLVVMITKMVSTKS